MTVWSMGDNSPNSQTIANMEPSNTFYANHLLCLVLINKCYWKTIRSLIGLSHKKKVSQAVSYPDPPYEDLCEDETTLYFSHSYLLNMA